MAEEGGSLGGLAEELVYTAFALQNAEETVPHRSTSTASVGSDASCFGAYGSTQRHSPRPSGGPVPAAVAAAPAGSDARPRPLSLVGAAIPAAGLFVCQMQGLP